MVQQCQFCGGLGSMCNGTFWMNAVTGECGGKPATRCPVCEGKGQVKVSPLGPEDEKSQSVFHWPRLTAGA